MSVFTSDKDTAYIYVQFFRPQYTRGRRGFLLEIQSQAEMFSSRAANPT